MAAPGASFIHRYFRSDRNHPAHNGWSGDVSRLSSTRHSGVMPHNMTSPEIGGQNTILLVGELTKKTWVGSPETTQPGTLGMMSENMTSLDAIYVDSAGLIVSKPSKDLGGTVLIFDQSQIIDGVTSVIS